MATMVAYTARMHADPVDPVGLGRAWADRIEVMLRRLRPRPRPAGPGPVDRRALRRVHGRRPGHRPTRATSWPASPLSRTDEQAMADYLAGHRRGRLGRIDYRAADVGLDADELRRPLRLLHRPLPDLNRRTRTDRLTDRRLTDRLTGDHALRPDAHRDRVPRADGVRQPGLQPDRELRGRRRARRPGARPARADPGLHRPPRPSRPAPADRPGRRREPRPGAGRGRGGRRVVHHRHHAARRRRPPAGGATQLRHQHRDTPGAGRRHRLRRPALRGRVAPGPRGGGGAAAARHPLPQPDLPAQPDRDDHDAAPSSTPPSAWSSRPVRAWCSTRPTAT